MISEAFFPFLPHSLCSFLKRYRHETLYRFKNSYTYDNHTHIIYGSIRGLDGAHPCIFVSSGTVDYFAIASISPVNWPWFPHHKIYVENSIDFNGVELHHGHVLPERSKLVEKPLIKKSKYPNYETYVSKKHSSWKKSMNVMPPTDAAWTITYDLDVNTGMVTPIIYTKKEY